MLASPVSLMELTVMNDENGKPLSMPDVGGHNVVVCGMTSINGVERLTICKSLYEMEIEYAYGKLYRVTIAEFRWYIADRQECEVVLNGMAANAV